ncbi:MAG TPA: uracil-DNA glycosylase [Burkholderiaceae bacterium]|nr:uracil-DNA glycosylase [Burkholderiaceae bacterium]
MSLFEDAPDTGLDNRLREPLERCFERVPGDWREITEPFRRTDAGQALIDYVDARVRAGATVFPAEVFRALRLTPRESVRVVILGQDPYHGAGQAQGLAFSVPQGMKLPPSLRNIRAEVAAGHAAHAKDHGDLTHWAQQGVLLLNTVLTVEEGEAHSHARRGWEILTDRLIAAVSASARPVIFLLWGAPAQSKAGLIDTSRHAVLTSNHPSPLSARRPPQPFIGCRHFSLANEWLARHRPGEPTIRW